MGRNPVLTRNADTGQLSVYFGDLAPAVGPTLNEKMNAAKYISERGYGMPAQAIHVATEVQAYMTQIAGDRSLGMIPVATKFAIRDLVRAAIAAHAPAQKVIDVVSDTGGGPTSQPHAGSDLLPQDDADGDAPASAGDDATDDDSGQQSDDSDE